jgi:3-hydroxyisobutyrate dehydrogenase-like beta-hydroxyacid dehydrogenase
MGYRMAGHLARAGHATTVFNRTATTAARWSAEYGMPCEPSAAAAAHAADVVLMCLGNDASVREMVLGDGAVLASMRPGAVLVDHTTASATLARELAVAARARGVGFVDAPVSGGQAGAEQGRLTVMCGGEAADFAAVEPLLGSYARCVRLLGAAGSGQLAKMVNQVCIGGVIAGLAEGLHFAHAAGLDAAAVVQVIQQGAALSWQMDNRSGSMLEGHYHHGFAVDWMRKDLGMVLDEARANGATLPLTALVDQFYAEVQALGGGRWDTSSLFARLQRDARGEPR